MAPTFILDKHISYLFAIVASGKVLLYLCKAAIIELDSGGDHYNIKEVPKAPARRSISLVILLGLCLNLGLLSEVCPWQISVQMLLGLLHVRLLTSPQSVLILHAVSLIGLKEQF